MKFYIMDKYIGKFFKKEGKGMTSNILHAYRFKTNPALRLLKEDGNNDLILLSGKITEIPDKD